MVAKEESKQNTLMRKVDHKLQSIKGFYYYNFSQRRKLICLVSSMRSGSTLLKALMGQAEDISHLSEYDFNRLNRFGKYIGQVKLREITEAPIVLLKKPRWFTDTNYPKIPSFTSKVIVLYRDVIGVVGSSMKRWPDKSAEELIDYWVITYQKIADNLKNYPEENIFFVKYEDLVDSPKIITRDLFEFAGSRQKQGISSYSLPEKEQWQWGKDDGSEKIKQLEVKATESSDPKLLNIAALVDSRSDVKKIREYYLEISERKSLISKNTKTSYSA